MATAAPYCLPEQQFALFGRLCPHFSERLMCIQADMRDFAWTEDEVEAKRARLVCPGQGSNAGRPTVFCFQTAVQAILWSKVAYNFL